MNKQKVLLISQVFYPDQVSTANLFTDLFSKFKNEQGIEVDVWCAQPSYSCFKRQPKHVIYNNININYLPSTNFQKNRIIGRLLNYLTFMVSVICKLIFSNEKTTVFTHTTPPSLGIIIAFIGKLKKRQVIYVLLDIFPDGLVRLGKLKDNSLLVNIWRFLYRSALKKCFKIIVIGRDMRKWLVEFCPEVSERVIYIPIWQDHELIKPIAFNDNKFVLKNNLKDKFVVQYSGNMGLWNDLETFGKAANSKIDNVIFLFIGGGLRKKELINSFIDSNLENILLFPFLSNEDYSESVTACHIALISLREKLEGMAVPSKIMGIMAAGIPVIALVPDESEIAQIVREESCGFVIKPGDVNGLIETILFLKSNPNLRLYMGQNGRNAFIKKYTTSIVSNSYAAIIKQNDVA